MIVDNGSSDNTPTLAKEFTKKNKGVVFIRLSRNFGKEASLSAGLFASTSEACVPVDADLQDPLDVIKMMIPEWENGNEVVLGRRKSRNQDSWFRTLFSKLYFQVFNALSDTELPNDVGEFRLMDKKVVDAFNQLPESQRFVRGLFAWMGFKTAIVEYDRPPRSFGKSSFSVFRLLSLGVQGLTSFSVRPLRLSTVVGALGATLTICYGIYILFLALNDEIPIPGYASTLLAVLFLGSVQLLSIGVLGEYIGRVLLETKNRPLYIISEEIRN